MAFRLCWALDFAKHLLALLVLALEVVMAATMSFGVEGNRL